MLRYVQPEGEAMRFLAGTDLHAVVGKVIAGTNVRCAVAFWGAGAEDLIADPTTAHIVCNLSLGGTNPGVIRTLMDRGAAVRQISSLHAKVYISAETAVVTSANASANGLALEGPEQAHWSEAGVELVGGKAASASDWFEGIWGQAQEIGLRDLARAEELWKARRRQRPGVSFADYDVEAAIRERTLPVTCWWVWGQEWEVDEVAVERAGIGFTAEMLAVEIEDEADRVVLPRGPGCCGGGVASPAPRLGTRSSSRRLGGTSRG
ncbi:phospholipase D family protein [Methylobacterium sp. NMS12]|uniref:phospholipase D family protein n=1 Tax=Methylobacterium sp. NMS12 TaxID=3079766 RepID=UPI003F883B23